MCSSRSFQAYGRIFSISSSSTSSLRRSQSTGGHRRGKSMPPLPNKKSTSDAGHISSATRNPTHCFHCRPALLAGVTTRNWKRDSFMGLNAPGSICLPACTQQLECIVCAKPLRAARRHAAPGLESHDLRAMEMLKVAPPYSASTPLAPLFRPFTPPCAPKGVGRLSSNEQVLRSSS